MAKRKRATKAQVITARNRLHRAWRKLEKARAMALRWQSAVVSAEEEKTRALANLDRVESAGFMTPTQLASLPK